MSRQGKRGGIERMGAQGGAYQGRVKIALGGEESNRQMAFHPNTGGTSAFLLPHTRQTFIYLFICSTKD